MKNHNLFKRTASVLGIFILFACGILYFGFENIRTRSIHISALKGELESETVKQEYLSDVQRMVNGSNEDISTINNTFVLKDGDVDFIENIEALARDNGLTITIDSLNIEDDKTLAKDGLVFLTVKARTKGNWKGTYTFLSKIENLPYKIKIDQYEAVGTVSDEAVDPKKKTKPEANWQSLLQLRVVKYK